MKIIKDRVNLFLEQTDKFSTFYLCVCLHRPLEAAEAAKNRLIPLVLRECSEKYQTQTELNSALAMLGGAELDFQTVKKGGRSILQFMIRAPRGNEEKVFELLSDMVYKPLLKDGDFAVPQTDKLRNIIENKSKREYAFEKCAEIMFDNKGFGICGDGKTEDLEKIGNLYEHYKFVLENSRADIFVLGNLPEERARELTDKYFPELKSTEINCEPQRPVEYKQCTEKADISQAKLCVGIDMGEGSRFEKQVFNELLGGSGNSRLFCEVREKENLCYYINSTFYSLVNAAIAEAGIQPQSLERIKRVVEEQLLKPTEREEIERAKCAIIGRTRGIFDHPTALMDFYLTQSLFDDACTVEEAMEKINGVTEIKLEPKISVVYMLGGEINDR